MQCPAAITRNPTHILILLLQPCAPLAAKRKPPAGSVASQPDAACPSEPIATRPTEPRTSFAPCASAPATTTQVQPSVLRCTDLQCLALTATIRRSSATTDLKCTATDAI